MKHPDWVASLVCSISKAKQHYTKSKGLTLCC